MSKLDELIKELCPNGVEYKELGEVLVSLNTGLNPRKFFRLNTEDATNYYVTIREIQKNRIQFSDKTDRINQEALILCNKRANLEKGDILFSGTGTIGEVAIVDETPNNWSIKEGVYSLKPISTSINSKFLMYILQTKNIKEKYFQKVVGGTVKSITMADLKKVDIPIPPLEIQEEIVRILDDYTKSVEELKEKLNKELIARKKQYSWYRDYLLNFENRVEIVKLGSISNIVRGASPRPISNYITLEEDGINWIKIGDVDSESRYVEETKEKITQEGAKKSRIVKKGDLILSNSMSFGRPYIVNQEGCIHDGWILISDYQTNYSTDFLYYLLTTNKVQKYMRDNVVSGTVQNLNIDIVKNIEIPLPPLEVQKRIVEVLDNFEKTCKELNIELSSEIEKKQKEYEFVRNYLLTFEEKSRQAILACELASLRSKQQAQNLIKILQYVYGYVEVRLGDIGSIVRGNGLQKRDFTEEGVGCIHYGQIYTKYGMATEKTISFVEESLAEKLRKVEKGNIIFAVTSENIEDLCKCVVWLGEEEIVTGGHTAILKHNQNSKFLAYYFQTEAFHSQKRKLATGTKVMDVTATKLEEILISLPPLEEQQRIVDILDRFDKLCNDISEGLPAEIEARQKQYEYYREKLLSFKKI